MNTDFSLSIPYAGWFQLSVGGFTTDISYLSYPFDEISMLLTNIIHYDICGGVLFEGEGCDTALHYSSESESLYLKDLFENNNKGKLNLTKKEITCELLPIFGIQSLWLLFGRNAVEFSTILDIEYDLGMEEDSPNIHIMSAIWDRYHAKENTGCIKSALTAMNTINSVLSNWYTTPKYIKKEGIKSLDIAINIANGNMDEYKSQINPKWQAILMKNIRSFMKLIQVDYKKEFCVRKALINIISGEWDSWLTSYNPNYQTDKMIDIPSDEALVIYTGLASIFELISPHKQSLLPEDYQEIIKEITHDILSDTKTQKIETYKKSLVQNISEPPGIGDIIA